MLPSNLGALSDDELVKFIENRKDPLIDELCRRLEARDWEQKLIDLEKERDEAVESAEELESTLDRIRDLV